MLQETLLAKGYSVTGINRKILDLTERSSTFSLLHKLKPQVVIDAAAVVGGIISNSSEPTKFLSQNVLMQTNLMDASFACGVEKFIFLGSSCIYPRDCPQPIKEEYLLSGPLETTNSAYAVAKIAGIELIQAYRKQFNRNWISIMPTNMYGPNDNFNVKSAHVIPALINRFVSAIESSSNKVELWGTGKAKRELLHSRDFASAICLLMESDFPEESLINVGSGMEFTIKEIAEMIAHLTGYNGEISWDYSKPDGTPRKLLDSSKIRKMGWSPKIELESGLNETIEWFKANRSSLRI